MTPEQKARELVEKFKPFAMDNHIKKYSTHNAKQLAIIACDEIIEVIGFKIYSPLYEEVYHKNNYWQSVKKSINDL